MRANEDDWRDTAYYTYQQYIPAIASALGVKVKP
jgi:hypothetical protein